MAGSGKQTERAQFASWLHVSLAHLAPPQALAAVSGSETISDGLKERVAEDSELYGEDFHV